MQIGVIIEKGPMDWQILQQKDGNAELALEGKWVNDGNVSNPRVLARLVREDTGESVVPWMECNMGKGNAWNIAIKNIPAGGLYRIETCLDSDGNNGAVEWAIRGDMIHHIGVGDIYAIAGQSNSAGYGKDPVYDPPEIGIHILRNNGKWDIASHPLNESTNTIHEENRERANPGHSPYLHFARLLKKDLGYPIGLIQAALGGSPLSRWNPGEEGTLYNSMIKTIKAAGGMIKGVLWYQGCGDTAEGLCETYLERFSNMVGCMRRDFGNNSLPFLTVQLNRYIRPSTESSDQCWGMVREAQRQAARRVSDVFVVPSVDCTLSDYIHNSSASNLVIGERLARVALALIYGKNSICMAPDISRAEVVEGKKVALTFINVFGRLFAFEVDVKDLPFTVIDTAGKLEICEYEIRAKNLIVLTLDREIKGRCIVHGAYEQNPKTFVPVDFESHLPMLAFHGFEASI